MWPSREKRRAWTITKTCGCPVVSLTSSFHTWWYHLIPNSFLKHHWSRALILSTSLLTTAQHYEPCRKMTRECNDALLILRHCYTTEAQPWSIEDWIDLIEQCFTSPPTQYRLYGRRFIQVRRPNQQYQSTEGKSTKENNPENKENTNYTCIHTKW